VNHKLFQSILRELTISGLTKPKKVKRADSNRGTTEDLVNRQFDCQFDRVGVSTVTA
jgi:hypothetical protein